MSIGYKAVRGFAVPVFFLVAAATAAPADTQQIVDGVEIYLGVVPAELVRGHPREHPESSMHGGVPVGQNHVMVALFDAKTGERIARAEVSARVRVRGGHVTEVEKHLEQMLIAGSQTYGNYFPMVVTEPYLIELTIRIPGRTKPVTARFEWAKT
jgi:hypothetical protein